MCNLFRINFLQVNDRKQLNGELYVWQGIDREQLTGELYVRRVIDRKELTGEQLSASN